MHPTHKNKEDFNLLDLWSNMVKEIFPLLKQGSPVFVALPEVVSFGTHLPVPPDVGLCMEAYTSLMNGGIMLVIPPNARMSAGCWLFLSQVHLWVWFALLCFMVYQSLLLYNAKSILIHINCSISNNSF